MPDPEPTSEAHIVRVAATGTNTVSSFDILLAALVHLLCGVVAVWGAWLFGFPWWYGALGVIGIAVVKETLIDPNDFEANPFWNGTLNSGAFDLSIYPVGILIGILTLVLANRVL